MYFHRLNSYFFSFGIVRAVKVNGKQLWFSDWSKDMPKQGISKCKHAVLRLGERNYAFDLVHVLEIIRCPQLEPSLDGPELQVGIYEGARGPLPVLDLLSRTPDQCRLNRMSLIIVADNGETICILADDVADIVEIDTNDRCPLPDGANGVNTGLLTGVVTISESDYYLLDLGLLRTAWHKVGSKAETGRP